jgi:hypothetical protein
MFCSACGQEILPRARFCGGCGRSLQVVPTQQAWVPQAPALPCPQWVNPNTIAPQTAPSAKTGSVSGVLGCIFAILLGLLLFAYGGRTLLLAVAGSNAVATVTGISRSANRLVQIRTRNHGTNSNSFFVKYHFTTAGGTPIDGNIIRFNVNDTSTLPSSGSPLQIHYFMPIPHLNAPSGEFPSLVDLLLLGVGILILWGNVKFRKTNQRTLRSARP